MAASCARRHARDLGFGRAASRTGGPRACQPPAWPGARRFATRPAEPELPDADRRPGKHAMMFVLITVLIDMIGIGIIMPVLPGLIGDIAHVDVLRRLDRRRLALRRLLGDAVPVRADRRQSLRRLWAAAGPA